MKVIYLWYFFTVIGWCITTIAQYPNGGWAMLLASITYYTAWSLGYYVRDEKDKKSEKYFKDFPF